MELDGTDIEEQRLALYAQSLFARCRQMVERFLRGGDGR
jgi:hypothetical protein